MEYRVTWVIDVDTDTERDAAIKACASQRRLTSSANVFQVQTLGPNGQPYGPVTEIDLDEIIAP